MQLAAKSFFAAAVLLVGCSHDWDVYDPRLAEVSPATSSASATTGSSSSSSGPAGSGGAGAAGGGGSGGAGATGGGGHGGCDASAYTREVLADQPAGYWRLGDVPGSMIAADSVGATPGQAAAGTTFGVPGALSCDGDTAASLDGTNGRIELGDTFDFVGSVPYTIEAWVKPAVLDITYRRIFSKEAYPVTGRQGYTAYARAPQMNAFGFERWLDGVTTSQLHADTSIPVDAWSHVVSVFDGTDCLLYLDGVMVIGIGFSMPADLIDHAGPFTWGASSNSTSSLWNGALDELAIYDKALPQARILAHYVAGKGM